MNVFGAEFNRNKSISLRFHVTSNIYHLVIFSGLLKAMNFRAIFTVVFLAFHASHRGFRCFYCFTLVLHITNFADDGGTPQMQSSLELQEVLHEEILLQTMHSIFRNHEFFTTQRTRHLLPWFLLLRFSWPIQASNTECMNAWQHSWIFECTHAYRTFCYFSEVFCSFFNCSRHLDLSCEPIKHNKVNNCTGETYLAVVHSKCILFVAISE